MKIDTGIILTGGFGSRTAPFNTFVNKHLLPVYNKFVIDYPLDTLKNIGVTKLNVVLGGDHFHQIVTYLKDGSHLGMRINYVYQNKPSGIAQAINLCEDFISGQFVTILGDNIFENPINFVNSEKPAQIVLHKHPELHRFGVASYKEDKLFSIEEKPKFINEDFDNYAITGCYLFDKDYFKLFKTLSPSARGEYEITDILKLYAGQDKLDKTFTSGIWSDAGLHSSINYLSNYFCNKSSK